MSERPKTLGELGNEFYLLATDLRNACERLDSGNLGLSEEQRTALQVDDVKIQAALKAPLKGRIVAVRSKLTELIAEAKKVDATIS